MTITQKAKTLIGQSVRITTPVGAMRSFFYHAEGVVESVKGVNGDCALVLFTNGKSAYLSHSDTLEIL